jgi:SAM-dependent methyltransferase
MSSSPVDGARRKQLGAWYTPDDLVATVVEAAVTADFVAERTATGSPVSVLDPACGDGRFLVAVAARVRSLGGTSRLTGVDVDGDAVAAARLAVPAASILHADALDIDWPAERFDLVIGNPPFLSQLASSTTRGGAGARGVGTYGDAAAEFLALAVDLVESAGGRVAMILPQSLLSSRDAGAVRDRIADRATLMWSWWSSEPTFDAQVLACALALEFTPTTDDADRPGPINWTAVVTDRRRIPTLAPLATIGRVGDRATLNANFRDQYYGLVGAVDEDGAGPPLITSGLVDPGRSLWGERAITFNRARFTHPRVSLDALAPAMQRWAERRLVPKVLVANQTAIIEALADPAGELLPGVPVIGVYPTGTHWAADEAEVGPDEIERDVWEIAAVFTSPTASAWLWHERAGTGLSAGAVRASPSALAALPWPAGSLDAAVDALRAGDLRACGRAVDAAYGTSDEELFGWWQRSLERIEQRGARSPA